jgi:type IV pilus biogenesis protein CpaD/CtpE
MSSQLTRRSILSALLAVPAGLLLGCNHDSNTTSAMPTSTAPPPPPPTGADAKKANSPTGGSSAGGDPNPGAS